MRVSGELEKLRAIEAVFALLKMLLYLLVFYQLVGAQGYAMRVPDRHNEIAAVGPRASRAAAELGR